MEMTGLGPKADTPPLRALDRHEAEAQLRARLHERSRDHLSRRADPGPRRRGGARHPGVHRAAGSEERPERTVLLTTHYMVEADELCGRVAIIDRGQILALDTPRALKRAHPEEPVFELQVGTGTAAFERLEGHRRRAVPLAPRAPDDRGDRAARDGGRGRGDRRGARAGSRSAEHPVLNLTKSEPTLETVFIHLVGRGLEERGRRDGPRRVQ